MARDARQLRQEAAEATSAGKHKRALGAYLELEPLAPHAALQRIAAMNEQIGAGPTRAVTMADNNPNLADNTAVAALRRKGTTEQQQVVDLDLEPPVAIPRTRTSKPLLFVV